MHPSHCNPLGIQYSMLGSHEARRFANLIAVFWKILPKYLTFPLRFVRYLLQLSRWFHCSHTNGRSGRAASSRQPPAVSQCSGQLTLVPGGGSASNVSILPPHPAPLLPIHAPQPPPAAPLNVSPQNRKFEPFIPSEVKRYDKDPSM